MLYIRSCIRLYILSISVLLTLLTISLFLETALAKSFVHLVYKQNDTCMDFNAAPACFGPPLPVTGLKGYLLETVPANACHPIKAAPVSNRTPSGFVALIRRYDCSFSLKVFHAQEAGYRAAIIYNLCSDFLVNMAISMEERRLPIIIPSSEHLPSPADEQHSAVPHKAAEEVKAYNKGQPRGQAGGQAKQMTKWSSQQTGSVSAALWSYQFYRTKPNR
uniref:PA domain-containing protein n=1 Tax=Laticauda laticaudata TaxID=8630 RepID=A0A8C5SIY5_LATLA